MWKDLDEEMGDLGATSDSPEEIQFQRDLETAKRLSLLDQSSSQPESSIEWPRPFSKPGFSTSPALDPPPFNKNRTVASQRHRPTANEVNLISLTSPKPVARSLSYQNPYAVSTAQLAYERNLIEFNDDILDIFDPLLQKKNEFPEKTPIQGQNPVQQIPPTTGTEFEERPTTSLYPSLDVYTDESNGSFYDFFNPFEYQHAVSAGSPWGQNSNKDIGFGKLCSQMPVPVLPPILIPPALPPRNSTEIKKDRPDSSVSLRPKRAHLSSERRGGKLYENLESVKDAAASDSELIAFFDMVRELRFSCRHVDSATNCGFVKSPIGQGLKRFGHSVKVIVALEEKPYDTVVFTSDLTSSVEMVTEQSIAKLELGGNGREYVLRVQGLLEYFDQDSTLADLRYVEEAVKKDEDLQLLLCSRSKLEVRSWARGARDDAEAVSLSLDALLPRPPARTLTYAELSIPLEVFDKACEKVREKGRSGWPVTSANLVQPVKAICVLLGSIETNEVSNALDVFVGAVDSWNRERKGAATDRRPRIGPDVSSRLSFVEIPSGRPEDSMRDFLFSTVGKVEEAVSLLLSAYSRSFPVSFRMKDGGEGRRGPGAGVGDMMDVLTVRLGSIGRLDSFWNTYDSFHLLAEVFHGTRWMGKVKSGPSAVKKAEGHGFFASLPFDSWMGFEGLSVCILPRESRLVLTLFGAKKTEDGKVTSEDLGWASIQLFDFKGLLVQGQFLLPFWPVGLVQKRLGPAPNSAFSSDGRGPYISIEFPDFGHDLFFPEVPTTLPVPRDFNSLDSNTQELLKDIVDHSTFTKFPSEDREVLWEKRHYLHEHPAALPKVLLAAQLWDWASLGELHALLLHWRPLDPSDALQLLLPCFPDRKVREEAVRWISHMPSPDLLLFLPQLVEALAYETFDFSPLARFLLKTALGSLDFSHAFFWLLAGEVGLGRFSKSRNSIPPPSDFDPKRRRFELMLNSLLGTMGANWREALIEEFDLAEGLNRVACAVKLAKDPGRNVVLMTELRKLSEEIFGGKPSIPLPLSPSIAVCGIDEKGSSFFNSASVPLKINFNLSLPEGGTLPIIFKAGDDLRQDMLTLQMIRLMEKWWLSEGLDLRVLTFACVPTGQRRGLVEVVGGAETLCRIQAEGGVTGPFRNRPIAEWLAKMNPSSLDYNRAVENFTRSTAAYCVATYVLGICDRHNDNIMLTKRGHLFHIDFGKFLGDAQMFGAFRRDRSPFVLTSDMAYVINGGEKAGHGFHKFVELACHAFRAVRANGNTVLNLFALMATAGVPGVDLSSVAYVQRVLLPEASNAEAAARFTRLIEESLQNWFTPVNFFIHSLGQLKFGSDANDSPTRLSFVPNTFTMEEDGKIEKAIVVSSHKKYEPEKHYMYKVKLWRTNRREPEVLLRSYKEFLELHTKLCLSFPMAVGALRTLPRGRLGRSNVSHVAEKRRGILNYFLDSLFDLADEIAHSSLVYTFFHSLLRDEDPPLLDGPRPSKPRRASPSRIHGELKLQVEYTRGALLVLVLHAVDLTCPGNQSPSPYVKTYLKPDAHRLTKRKTRVVRRSQHPTFMEMIEYRLPLDVVRSRTLVVSVWHYDPLQENNFLGGVSIPLNQIPTDTETTATYQLGNVPNS